MADQNYQKCSDLDKTGDSQVFGIAESKPDIAFTKFKITDPICNTKII